MYDRGQLKILLRRLRHNLFQGHLYTLHLPRTNQLVPTLLDTPSFTSGRGGKRDRPEAVFSRSLFKPHFDTREIRRWNTMLLDVEGAAKAPPVEASTQTGQKRPTWKILDFQAGEDVKRTFVMRRRDKSAETTRSSGATAENLPRYHSRRRRLSKRTPKHRRKELKPPRYQLKSPSHLN